MEETIIELKNLDPNFKYEIAKQSGGEMIMRCFACGTCSASCPIRELEERYNPRKIIRMVILGMKDMVLSSEFIWLCAHCYSCYERCPQDVRFTSIIHAIRNMALQLEKEGKIKIKTPNLLFARLFINLIKKYGRIWEPELMFRLFIGKKDFKGMLSYVPLGVKLLKKGKLNLFPHTIFGIKEIKNIFKRIEIS